MAGYPGKAAYNAWIADSANNGFVASLSAAQLAMVKSNCQAMANILPAVNLKDYDAAGDGVTDDMAAIAAWLAASPAVRHFAPSGNYRHSGSIVLSGFMEIAGAGGISTSTIFSYTGAGAAAWSLSGNNNSLSRIQIIAPSAGNGLLLTDTRNNQIEDVNVTGTGLNAGITLTSAGPGCGWNSINRAIVTSQLPLQVDKGTGWVNFNQFNRMQLISTVTTAGQVIFIRGGNNNLFQHVDASYYGTGASISINLQAAPVDNTFVDVFIDTNATNTGYYLSLGTSGLKILGGGNGAGTPINDNSGRSDNFFLGVTPTLAQLGAVQVRGGLSPPSHDGSLQTGHIFQGSGVPNNANGNNGDFYFRTDGAGGTSLYMRRAGAWVGIV